MSWLWVGVSLLCDLSEKKENKVERNVFEMKKEWAALKQEVTGTYASNMTIQVWGPSPIAPEPLRPLR